MQFDRPSEADGIVIVFRREASPYEVSAFELYGIDETGSYLISDSDGGEFEIRGNSLKNDGFRVTIPDKRTAKIYFYKKIN